MIPFVLAVVLSQASAPPADVPLAETVTVPDDKPTMFQVERGAFTVPGQPDKFVLAGQGFFVNSLGYRVLEERTDEFQKRIKQLEVENAALDSSLTKRLEEPRITVAVLVAVGVLAAAAGAVTAAALRK